MSLKYVVEINKKIRIFKSARELMQFQREAWKTMPLGRLPKVRLLKEVSLTSLRSLAGWETRKENKDELPS